MSICLRYAENRQDAVEVLNDGFLRVFQYIRKFNMDKPFRPWFRTIMIRCAIDHFRKSMRQVETIQLEEGKNEVSEEVLEGRISYQEMIGIVQRLPRAYRTVFNLIAIEGYTHEEVASMLDISAGTSKSNYHRAKQKLQQYLKEYFVE
jgi:RNA polymerase sigma-70 factor (ECF subfamily)